MNGEPLATRKYWVHDNDGKYGPKFRALFKGPERKSVPTSICAPNMNAFAERWVLSVKRECLDHFVFISQAQLRSVVETYVTKHFNVHRPHQGIGNIPIGPWDADDSEAAIVCDEHLNGVLKSFRRVA